MKMEKEKKIKHRHMPFSFSAAQPSINRVARIRVVKWREATVAMWLTEVGAADMN